MNRLAELYRPSLSLLTDLYQLTMAYGYWKTGTHRRKAVFHLFFRTNPFQGGYAVAAGLETALDWMAGFRLAPDDADYLAGLTGVDGAPLFEQGFLRYLADLRLTLSVDAVPEGTVVFPHEPLIRVEGNLLEAQLLETALLTIVNFQTLIATKAARVVNAAGGDPVIEFGLRRAQGIDGGLSASRAAFIGGCAGTSNVLAGKHLGIPVRGTHAHSWVMSFDDEREAFQAYAESLPNNCVFLVDTYDTLLGVRRAIEVGRQLQKRGHEMGGVRLDSGDLAWLSIEARRMLDEAGFPRAQIVASNDLDEQLIESLKAQGARIGVWGVGTRLVTGGSQPALGGVYKLAAVRDPGGPWRHKLKISEQAIKTSIPGLLQVRRFRTGDGLAGDMIFDQATGSSPPWQLIDPGDPQRKNAIPAEASFEDLLVPVVREGREVCNRPSLIEIQSHARRELAALSPRTRRLLNPHEYTVGISRELHELRGRLVEQCRVRDS
jgi:nicotinate phosphoribosyltransferase